MKIDFTGKTVIVTGGTRGIGRAITDTFLENGATVIAIYAGNHEAAEEMRVLHAGRSFEAVQLDVSDYQRVDAFFSRFDQMHHDLFVLVNNAGIRRDNALAMMPFEDWNAVIQTNLTGTFNMSKFAVARMSPRRCGRIISVTSSSGRIGIAGQSNYAAAKAGQTALTKSLSKEVARRNITVNCVSPGFTDTELLADLSPEQRKACQDMVPLRRFARAGEIADAVLFLASDSAAYITGQTLEISGGL